MRPADPIISRRFWTALAVVVAAVVALWLQYPPRYLTNDDVAIRLGLEGRAVPGEAPTGFVLMTHAALGWTLVSLQRWMPNLPLWDVVVAAVLLCSLAVLFALAWSALGRGWIARLTAVGALFVAAVPLIANVQFTIGAALAGAASMILATMELGFGRPRRRVVLLSATLFLAGVLVRPMAAAAGAASVGAFLAAWALWPARLRGRLLAQYGITVAGALVAAAGLIYVDAVLYRARPEWDAYNRHNWMAAQLTEWGGELPAHDIAAIRAAADWTVNDWAMMQRWSSIDPAVHGFDRVTRAYDARAEAMGWRHSSARAARRAVDTSVGTVAHVVAESTLPLLAIAIVTALYTGWSGRATVALGMTVFLIECIAIEAWFKDLPFRLLAPLVAGIAAAALAVVATRRREPSAAAAIIGLAMVLTMVGSQTRTVLTEMVQDRRHTAQVEQEVLELLRLSPSLLVLHADAFPAEHWWRPFVRPPIELAAVPLAGSSNPQLQRFLTATGRQPLPRAICDDPSILVVSERDRLELVTTYMREHFNRTVDWTEVYAGSFRAWRCG